MFTDICDKEKKLPYRRENYKGNMNMRDKFYPKKLNIAGKL